MSGPRPSDVGGSDLYDRFGPKPLIDRTAVFRDRLKDALMNPEQATGWPGILIPAVISALLINFLRNKI